MSLSSKHNYLNKDIKYIKNGLIQEYDMKNGGISILYHKGILSQDDYDYLMNNLDKQERNITIGKWLKDNSDVTPELMNGFKEARELFFEMNDIKDSEVLSIKKDAIFLIGKSIEVEQVNEDYLFRKKNEYTTYINLSSKEFYYNVIEDTLDIKGLSKESLRIQNEYLIKTIKECLKLDSDGNKEALFIKLLEFKNDFLTKKLPIEYYYDMILDGYIYKYENHTLQFDKINNELLNNKYLNLNNNLKIILELISNLLN